MSSHQKTFLSSPTQPLPSKCWGGHEGSSSAGGFLALIPSAIEWDFHTPFPFHVVFREYSALLQACRFVRCAEGLSLFRCCICILQESCCYSLPAFVNHLQVKRNADFILNRVEVISKVHTGSQTRSPICSAFANQ